jgi:adenylate cyclase
VALRRLHFAWKLLVLLPIPLIWCVLAWSGSLAFFENRWVDWRFRYRGEIDAPVKIVYVNIDSRSLDPQEIGGWPWNRSYFEVVCRTLLERAGVKAVGIDVVLSDSGISESADLPRLLEGNLQFYRFLYPNPPVVLAAAFSGHQFRDALGRLSERKLPLVVSEKRALEQIEAPELPNFLVGRISRSPPTVGLIDTENGGTRAVPLYAPSNVRTYYHLTVELARRYWDVPAEGVTVTARHLEFKRADGSLVARVPLRDRQFLDVNWFSRWSSERNLRESFSVVYAYALNLEDEDPEARASAEAFFAQEDFRDAIVLIGPVDPLLQDLAPTSLDDAPVPKVSVHGNVLKSMISGEYLQRLPRWGEVVAVMILSLLVTALALSGGARAVWLKAAAGMLAIGYAAAAFELFRLQHIVLPMVAPLGAAFTASFAGIFWQVLEEQKARGRLKTMFGTYLAPEVVEQMVESGQDPQLGGHDLEITAYFSDIQNFTSFSELLPSAQLGELLNEYLTACTDIVQAERGTLDKYIGDAVVAMFGAPVTQPDHAYRACVASQRVHQRLAELRDKWKSEGARWPTIVSEMRTRIGLNTGVCMIGNMGSRTRFNYTMMGDNVNLAARMESGAKRWGVYTLVTEATKAACESRGRDVVFRSLGRIVVAGRAQPVPIYDIVGLKDHLAREAFDCVELFEAALERYHARDWNAARALFERSAALEPLQPGRDPGVKTNPSLAYLWIVADMAVRPPAADWDGVYVMAEK